MERDRRFYRDYGLKRLQVYQEGYISLWRLIRDSESIAEYLRLEDALFKQYERAVRNLEQVYAVALDRDENLDSPQKASLIQKSIIELRELLYHLKTEE